MDRRDGAGRIISPRVLAVPEPVQLVRRADMSSRAVSFRSPENGGVSQNGTAEKGRPQGLVLRLNSVPETPENRARISERVRLLNRALEEPGTPFRVRLL